jgi:double-stranded uracil-DNA glycosylase
MKWEPPEAAVQTLPDLLAPGIEILFVGINPSVYSAQAGHYYARPGNMFWRCLHESGLTPVRLRPEEDRRVLEWGIGITDCVKRPTVSAAELSPAEFREGVDALLSRIALAQPRVVCFNGLVGYRGAFDPRARLGRQERRLEEAVVFVVPSTSGANAAYSRQERIEWFTRLRDLRDLLRREASMPESAAQPAEFDD